MFADTHNTGLGGGLSKYELQCITVMKQNVAKCFCGHPIIEF